jgi:hypothetical protein
MLVAQEGRSPRPRFVTHTGALDLDHLGAEIAEHLSARWAGEYAAEIEDRDAVEWNGRHGAEPTPGIARNKLKTRDAVVLWLLPGVAQVSHP